MMEDKQIGVPTNVAVFIDYENVYKALLEEKTNVLRLAFFEKLRKWCSEHQLLNSIYSIRGRTFEQQLKK